MNDNANVWTRCRWKWWSVLLPGEDWVSSSSASSATASSWTSTTGGVIRTKNHLLMLTVCTGKSTSSLRRSRRRSTGTRAARGSGRAAGWASGTECLVLSVNRFGLDWEIIIGILLYLQFNYDLQIKEKKVFSVFFRINALITGPHDQRYRDDHLIYLILHRNKKQEWEQDKHLREQS